MKNDHWLGKEQSFTQHRLVELPSRAMQCGKSLGYKKRHSPYSFGA